MKTQTEPRERFCERGWTGWISPVYIPMILTSSKSAISDVKGRFNFTFTRLKHQAQAIHCPAISMHLLKDLWSFQHSITRVK